MSSTEFIAQQLRDAIFKLDNSTRKNAINKKYEDKVSKAKEERDKDLAALPDNKAEKKKLTDALIALGHTLETSEEATTPVADLNEGSKNWNEKFDAAYAVVNKEAARKVVILKVGELYPNIDITSKGGKNRINAALGKYKRDKGIK